MSDVETLEQTPAVQTEQVSPAAEQESTPVAGGAVEPVAADAGAVAEPIDWSNPDSVRGVIGSPEYRGLQMVMEENRLNALNEGVQKRDQQMRALASSDESLAERLENIALKKGWDSSDESLREVIAAFHEPSTAREARNLAYLHIEQASRDFSADAKQALQIAMDAAGDDVSALNSVVGQLWTYQGESAKGEGRAAYEAEIAALTPEEARKNTTLASLFEKWRDYEDSAEAGAQKAAAGRIDPGPSTTTGRPVAAGTNQRYLEMNADQLAALPEAEYQQAKKLRLGIT